ncbi:hypothetical protein Salat_2116300 [Sesamum alatum]|uniref:Uncharacterized protein n=1 Tax=Sesamum alatum TaxID=300844 RepID=A0AAE1Y1A4_9LAMI|nr:hypothetical protein Salat_2116300 [Sesamum alatum]
MSGVQGWQMTVTAVENSETVTGEMFGKDKRLCRSVTETSMWGQYSGRGLAGSSWEVVNGLDGDRLGWKDGKAIMGIGPCIVSFLSGCPSAGKDPKLCDSRVKTITCQSVAGERSC